MSAPRPFGRRHGRLLLGLVVALGLALSACTGGSSPAAPTSPATLLGSPPPLTSGAAAAPVTARFTDCRQAFTGLGLSAGLSRKLSFGCAKIPVPLDYAKPDGATISLQLLKIHDSDNKHSLGSLLVNPGGPGASGLELALGLVGELSPDILDHFDIIGFDPRGVGLSSPLSCVSNKRKDVLNAASPDVLTTAGLAQAKALAKSFDTACATKYGATLADFTTVNTARDMDRIRVAVGDARMNYLGFSYGTELGSIYAHLYPGRVRVAVLDGAVDPLTSGITQFADQLRGFESAFDQFAQDCLTRSPCKSLGNPRQVVYDIENASEKKPLETKSNRPLTAALASTGVLQALYSRSQWTQLGTALIDARSGDGTALLALADQYNERASDGSYSNVMDANIAISCNDQVGGPSDPTIAATAKSWARKYPMFGKWSAGSLFTCQQWQPVRTVPPKPVAPTATKVLVIGNLHDPATPYQGAKDLTAAMGNAELLSWDGEGHTSYLEGSSCIDDKVNQYLISQTLPSANTTCPR